MTYPITSVSSLNSQVDLELVVFAVGSTQRPAVNELLGDLNDFLESEQFDCEGGELLYLPLPGRSPLRGAVVVPVGSSPQALYEIQGLVDQILALVTKKKARRVGLDLSAFSEEAQLLLLTRLLAYPDLSFLRSTVSADRPSFVLVDDNRKLARVAQAQAEGLALAKRIVTLPPNEKRPVNLAEELRQLFSDSCFSVEVWDRQELIRRNAGGILAVGRASEPVLVKVTYTPATFSETVALVLKGVTMDTGGYGIKPGATQEAWKGDCGGLAAGAGALLSLASSGCSSRVVAYMPIVENLISEDAMLFGEVLTMANGMTVEVGHTDAEGRLILADALALSVEENPSLVIDVATLTTSALAALGPEIGSLLSNDDEVAAGLVAAGADCGEMLWRMPLYSPYAKALKGRVADLRNIGAREGDAITSALFLQHFVPNGAKWAHLDIAGAALQGLEKGMGSGFCALTLLNFLAAL